MKTLAVLSPPKMCLCGKTVAPHPATPDVCAEFCPRCGLADVHGWQGDCDARGQMLDYASRQEQRREEDEKQAKLKTKRGKKKNRRKNKEDKDDEEGEEEEEEEEGE